MAIELLNDLHRSDDTYHSRSVDRAFAILECLSVATAPMTLIDISRAVGLDRSVTYRFLAILTARGYVHKHPVERVYSIGFGIYKLGRRSHALKTITTHAEPFLRKLAAETRSLAHLATLEGAFIVIYSKIAAGRLDLPTRPGVRIPANATALGKALLSYRSADDVQQTLKGGPLPGFTSSTITDAAALFQDVRASRRRGYAIASREYLANIVCVAAPIVNPIGKAAMALSLSIRAAPEPSRAGLAELGGMVAQTAVDIAQYIVGPAADRVVHGPKELDSD
jgi:DNA-binding IclR family transcriptional regulator